MEPKLRYIPDRSLVAIISGLSGLGFRPYTPHICDMKPDSAMPALSFVSDKGERVEVVSGTEGSGMFYLYADPGDTSVARLHQTYADADKIINELYHVRD